MPLKHGTLNQTVQMEHTPSGILLRRRESGQQEPLQSKSISMIFFLNLSETKMTSKQKDALSMQKADHRQCQSMIITPTIAICGMSLILLAHHLHGTKISRFLSVLIQQLIQERLVLSIDSK